MENSYVYYISLLTEKINEFVEARFSGDIYLTNLIDEFIKEGKISESDERNIHDFFQYGYNDDRIIRRAPNRFCLNKRPIIEKAIDEIINEKRKGIINYKSIFDDEKALPIIREVIKEFPIEEVNNGQFKLIIEEDSKKVKFDISPNSPYYLKWDETNLKRFLEKSNKIQISPEIAFIPLELTKNDYLYVLVANDLNERLELYRLKSFNQLNKQLNLFSVIEFNIPEELEDHMNKFVKYVVKKLQEYQLNNTKLLKEVYKNNLSNFSKDSKLNKQF